MWYDMICLSVQERGNVPYALRRLVGCNHFRAYEWVRLHLSALKECRHWSLIEDFNHPPIFKIWFSNLKLFNKKNRGITEESTQLAMISPIGYFNSPIGDILTNWVLVNCSLTLCFQTHICPIPNWLYYPQLAIISPMGIWDHQLGIKSTIGDFVC